MIPGHINVLELVGYLGRGGDTTAVLTAANELSKYNIQFDFMTHDGADERLIENLRRDGHRVAILKGDFRELKFGYQSAVCSAVESLGVHYDFFHAHTSLQSGIALGAAKRLGIPNRICHSHVSTIQREANPLFKFLLEGALRRACIANSTLRVACSKAAGDYLFGKHDYDLIYNGIDISAIRDVDYSEVNKLRCVLGLTSDVIVFGHVARFSTMKNQLFTLKLAERFKNDSRFVFLFVGNGSTFEEISNIANEMHLGNVRFLGRRNDVPLIMNLLDYLLLPSRPGEGFPMTVLEGTAAGARSIVSNNVTNEISMLGTDFVMRLPLDLDDWSHCISSSSKKGCKSPEMGCITLAKNGLDLQSFSAKWAELYRN